MISYDKLRWAAVVSAGVVCFAVIFSALANPLPDNDGLPDWWELKYFGNDSQTESGDPDLDGLTNLQEYNLGTVPTDHDTDYDGIGDGQEIFDGTQPTNSISVFKVQLGSWRFDSNSWFGLQGQKPLTSNYLASVGGISGKAVSVYSNSAAILKYRDAEVGGRGNVNCREGSVRFWFKPAWNSSTTNSGTGPQSEARLLDLGLKGNVTYGYWGLMIGSYGTNIYFCTQTNIYYIYTTKTNLSAPITWKSNEWHQIVLTYSKTNSALYLDGKAVTTTGQGITNFPSLSGRTSGLRIGSDWYGGNQARGRFDNLETFNYVLSGSEITNGYVTPCQSAVDVMPVIDRSGSMLTNIAPGVNFLDAAKLAVSNLVTKLDTNTDQCGFTYFSTSPATTSLQLTNNLAKWIYAVTNMPGAEVYTHMSNALWTAQLELASTRHNPEALPVMVFLSDGQPNDISNQYSVNTSNLVIAAATTVKNAGTRLITVGLGTNAAPVLMSAMATTTNDFYAATNLSQLFGVYDLIAQSICRLSNAPPTIAITNPTDGQSFTGPTNLLISASAADAENGLAKVEFYAGNIKIGEDYHAPFTISWTAPVGTTNLTAVARDEYGLSTTSSVVSITVTAPVPALTVQFTSPTNNQLFVFSPTNILLKATNTVGTITKMLFYNGSSPTPLGEATATPYQFLWTNVPAGNYTLKAVGTNSSTGVSATNTVSIVVNAMPVITNNAPTNIQAFNFIGSVNVSLTNSAWDTDGTVTNVTFYTWTNGVIAQMPAASSNNGTWTLTWNGLTNGYYSYYAVATDNRGAQSDSPIGVFKVNPTNVSPQIWITYPTNNEAFRAGADITITASTIDGSGTVTNVEFFVGDRLLGSDSQAPWGITECCWQPGNYKLTVRATDTCGSIGVSTNITIVIGPKVPTSGEGYWDPNFGLLIDEYFSSILGYPWILESYPVSIAPGSSGIIHAAGYMYDYQTVWGPFSVSTDIGWTNWGYIGTVLGGDSAFGWSSILADETNVYAGGGLLDGGYPNINFTNTVIKWDGTNWSSLGNALYDVYPILYKFNGHMYVVGGFTESGYGSNEDPINTNVQRIAKLDLVSNQWTNVGNGISNGTIYTIVAMNDVLYIGGSFTNAGGNSNANYIARLDGDKWTDVGLGVSSQINTGIDSPRMFGMGNILEDGTTAVTSLAVCGTNLFVGGNFTTAGSNTNANGVAVWNTKEWQSIGNGIGVAPRISSWNSATNTRMVATISARGDRIYVGGEFTNVFNQDGLALAANNIAVANWIESENTWKWANLDHGTGDAFPGSTSFGNVYASLIVEGNSPNQYDLYVAGYFRDVGSSKMEKSGLARWRVGYPPPTQPFVVITNPINLAIFTNLVEPFSISITAVASTNINAVEFYVDGKYVGNGTDNLDESYTFNWPDADWDDATNGLHRLKAVAMDNAGLQGESKEILINVKGTNIFAYDDTFSIPESSSTVRLPVLTNDLPSVHLKEVVQLNNNLGRATPGHDGTYISYVPFSKTFGTDRFIYTVTNSSGQADSAWVTVKILAYPEIQITSPNDLHRTNPPVSGMTITGTTRDWDGSVSNISVFVNGGLYKSFAPIGINFTTNWSQSTPGYYTFTAVATDNDGLSSTSAPVTVVVTTTSVNPPVAIIANLTETSTAQYGLTSVTLPVIRDGFFQMQGTASGDSPVAYQVLLYRPDDWEDIGELSELIAQGYEPFANITPPGTLNAQDFRMGSVVNGNLGTNDLTSIPNGIYDLVLRVRGGTDEALDIVRVQIDSQLKLGQFSFSEQDLVLPVNGIPLTVTRTYNSMNPRSGDFGYGWTYALNDMDVVIDEQRVTATAIDTLDSWVEDSNSAALNFSMRVGGGRNVTLTLPDGHRATFQFYYANTTSAEDAPMAVDGEWIAPPGVTAKLSTPNPATKHSTGDDTIFALFSPMKPYWQAGGSFTPLEAHDIPEFVLTTEDGTKFHITRDAEGEDQPTYIYQDNDGWFGNNPQTYYIKPHPGKPRLTKIVQRSGDYIKITDTGLFHYNATNGLTRSMFMQRDAAGRITALFDPNSGVTNNASIQPSTHPLIRYVYNRDTGNLIQVQRLQDRTAGNYLVTKYHYDHPQFPHYITSIEDPRGIPLARNEYDDSGKLIAVVDADGKRTAFIHNTTNRVEIVTDRLGNTNSFVYDLRGNVTATTNALGQITTMAYDEWNNKTNDVAFFNGQPYATNHYVFINTNLLQATINALGHSNTFTYGPRGRLEVSTDTRGFSTTNYFDDTTDLLIASSDALGNVTSNYYNSRSLIAGTRDALGTVTTNYFDASGNLTATAALSASGTILSTNSFAYDLNGNQTNSVTWRRVNGDWTGATNTAVFDAQNRVVQTIAPDGGENLTFYNALGKQDYTVDALNRTNRFEYDAQGRLFKTIAPDGLFELSYFDAEGRRTNSVNRAQRSTLYAYDQLGRITNTVYADNTTGGRSYYDDLGRVQFSVDARGVTNAFGYDILGRRSAVTNAYLTSVAMINFFGYDAGGNQPYVTNALGVVTTNILDALNRVTQVQFADGTKVFTGYDAIGRRVAETNQDNIVTRFGYDGAGRLVSVTNAFGVSGQQTVTRYEFDEAGNQTAQIDALNRTNRYAFDNMGRRISHTMPDTTRTETFGYDKGGNLLYHTNFNGVVITNQFDAMNRLTNRSSVNGFQIAYGYSLTGQRTNMTDVSTTNSYAYDSRDRLTNKVVSWTGTSLLNVALNYRYDVSGSLTSLWSSTSTGVTNFYQHDALNRLTNVLGRDSVSAGYTFDLIGNLQTVRYGSGVTNLYQYDRLNRLTNAVWKLNAGTLGSFYYKLGLNGMRTNLDETLGGNRTYTWQYDALYRLTNETINAAVVSYGYDLVGNRTNRTSGVIGLGNQSFTFNTNDWQTSSDGYDNNGNTTGSGGSTYQYDVLNRLTNVNGTILIGYDGDGNRVSKKVGGVTTYYLVDDRNPTGYAQVVEEYQGSTLTAVYTHGLDLVSQRRAGTVSYYIYDGHGSVRALTSTSGTVTDTYQYDAYGTKLNTSSGSTLNNNLYTGEQFDSDLGFYYLRARYYKPDTGRFQTMDSYEGTQTDPPSLHKYLYCHANPVNGVDPSGHLTTIEVSMGKTFEAEMRNQNAIGSSIAGQSMRNSIVFKIGAWAIIGGVVAGNVAMLADALLPAPQQQAFERYKNKYSGVQYACVRYAGEFKRQYPKASFVAFRIKESEPPNRVPYASIMARSGLLFDKGAAITINGFHVGAVLNNLVFDNNILGLPLPLWGENYYMAKHPDPSAEFSMNEAVRMGFGEMRLYTNEADVPHSRWNTDGKWNRGVSVSY